MGYAKSFSRKEFEYIVDELIATARKASIKKNGYSQDITQMVFRSAIFQCSAAFEEYVRNSFEDWIELCGQNKKHLKQFPEEAVLFAAVKSEINYLKRYISDGDERKLIKSLMENKKIKLLYNEKTKVKEVIFSNILINDRKYPSIKNIEILYGRFGITRVINKISERSKKNFKERITSFSDIRTSLAHEYLPSNLTFEDVRINIGYIKDTVNYLDRLLCSHVLKKSGAICWKT